MYMDEIQVARNESVVEKRCHPMGLPRYAGRAQIATMKKIRLQNLFTVLSYYCY